VLEGEAKSEDRKGADALGLELGCSSWLLPPINVGV